MPLLAGVIWDHIGAPYVFIVAVAIDALARLPLLASIPETLHPEGKGASDAGPEPG